MNYYFDISAISNADIVQCEIMAVLMDQLHLKLIAYDGHIGIDFPNYSIKATVGNTFRLIGTQKDINLIYDELVIDPIFMNYSIIKEVFKVPDNIKIFAEYKRYHFSGTSSRLRRIENRAKAQGTWNENLRLELFKKYSLDLKMPHLNIKSSSTKQSSFKLFIKETIHSSFKKGIFNSYGLSIDNATIPKF